MKRGKFNIIIGGQAGSEAKGKLSGFLCEQYKPDLLVMTASPNAGHTVVTDEGVKKVSYHLPIGMVMCDAPVVLGPASLINVVILEKEIHDLGVDPNRIMIDPRASIITPGHVASECNGRMSDIGSTLQGIGECRTGKMRRKDHYFVGDIWEELGAFGVQVGETTPIIHMHMSRGDRVLCEATQGFDLDLEHGIDRRYCTSKMINTSMVAAEAGVPPSMVGEVYGVIRPYPIRVNNRTGSSGPYAEAEELSWGVVADRCGAPYGFEGEITTTTKLPRRVFEFCWSRFEAFLQVCRPTSLCLQFANYLNWSAFGAKYEDELRDNERVTGFIEQLEDETMEYGDARVDFVGTGPQQSQMVWRR